MGSAATARRSSSAVPRALGPARRSLPGPWVQFKGLFKRDIDIHMDVDIDTGLDAQGT